MFPLCLAACQPIHFASREDVKTKATPLSEDDLPWKKEPIEDTFVSNKLDLVFVFDVQPGMDKFYETPLLNEEFLDGLDGYNVKMAYTNTAVDKKLLEEKFTNDRECDAANVVRGTGLTVAGIFVHPIFLPFGLDSASPCFSVAMDVFKKSYPKVNGEFLPFELNGEELSPQLLPEDENYRTVFQHTITKNTAGLFDAYDAPQSQNEESYPLAAMLLSLARGSSFFEEDSQVVFLLFSPQDTSQTVSAQIIRQNFAKVYKNGNRFHVIPIVIDEGDSLCNLKMKELGVKSPQPGSRLSQIASDMGMQSFSLCSLNLSQELSLEIRTLLTSEES